MTETASPPEQKLSRGAMDEASVLIEDAATEQGATQAIAEPDTQDNDTERPNHGQGAHRTCKSWSWCPRLSQGYSTLIYSYGGHTGRDSRQNPKPGPNMLKSGRAGGAQKPPKGDIWAIPLSDPARSLFAFVVNYSLSWLQNI